MLGNYRMDHQYADAGIRVIPRIVVLKMCYRYMKSYSYLVMDPRSRQAVIVDPAWQMQKVDQSLILMKASLSGVSVTHAHPDHIHLAHTIDANSHPPVFSY